MTKKKSNPSRGGRPKVESFHREAAGWDRKKRGPRKELASFVFKCPRKKGEALSKYLPRRMIAFIESNLQLTSGRFAGKKFKLFAWQKEFIKDVFGTLDRRGRRRFKKIFLSVSRKNGKTELISSIVCYLLFTHKHLEVLSAGADSKQAGILFDRVVKMIEANPKLKDACRISHFMRVLTIPENHVSFKVISSESYSKHGYTADVIVCDELHAWRDKNLFDVLEKSLAPAEQPLMFVTTTSGNDKFSLWKEHYEFLKEIKAGKIDEPSTYVKIFELDEKDDWKNPANWPKANPSYPTCPDDEYLQGLFVRAQHMRTAEFSFKWQNLNMWTDQGVGFIDMEIWRGGAIDFDLKNLAADREFFGGLDLASRNDFSCFALVSPPPEGSDKFIGYTIFFLNEAKVRERSMKGLPCDRWVAEGYVITNPGRTTDYSLVEDKILELSGVLKIAAIAYDRKDANPVVQRLEERGNLTMIEHGQGFFDMSGPVKELGKLILDGDFLYQRNPALDWMMSNVVCDTDASANLKPNKEKAADAIDGFSAIAMALGAYLKISQNQSGKSVYDTRGLLTVSLSGPTISEKQQERSEINNATQGAPQTIGSCPVCQNHLQKLNGFDWCPRCSPI